MDYALFAQENDHTMIFIVAVLRSITLVNQYESGMGMWSMR